MEFSLTDLLQIHIFGLFTNILLLGYVCFEYVLPPSLKVVVKQYKWNLFDRIIHYILCGFLIQIIILYLNIFVAWSSSNNAVFHFLAQLLDIGAKLWPILQQFWADIGGVQLFIVYTFYPLLILLLLVLVKIIIFTPSWFYLLLDKSKAQKSISLKSAKKKSKISTKK